MSRPVRARRSLYAGLVLMVVGLVDPLEGSPVIAAGTGLVALAAWLQASRQRVVTYAGFALTAFGVAALWVLSGFGGVGGSSGHSWWWLLFVVPFPVGWVLSLVGALRMRREASGPPAT